MLAAVNAVRNGKLSIRASATKYDIPHQTVRDYVTGRSTIGMHPGRKPVLTPEEEQALVEWCLEMNRIGYGRTKAELLSTVKKIFDKEGRNVPMFK